MKFLIGDIVKMKKPHPCGSYEWKVLRAGMDFRIECTKCSHQVMLPRIKFEKNFKAFLYQANREETESKNLEG